MEMFTSKFFPRLEVDCDETQMVHSESDSKGQISYLIGSSNYEAVSDDACKDEDNAGWILELEPDVRDEWIERISWIRLVDRLAEHELLCTGETAFQDFLEGWEYLLRTNQVKLDCAYQSILAKIKSCWFGETDQLVDVLSIQSWDRYVKAIARYHADNLTIHTFEQYEEMLFSLGGSFFQILPFLTDKHRQVASYFGILDQFYNHLRDLREDAAQGICYLPTELLNWFDVSRHEILQQSACQNPNYVKMMQFWLDEYLPRLRRKARQLVTADDLHPSWEILRDWSVYRYRRIDMTFRECGFDYLEFSEVYWQGVKSDLPMLLTQIRQERCLPQVSQTLTYGGYAHLRGWRRLAVLPSFAFTTSYPSIVAASAG
jgi:phytoene synthase